MKKSTNNKHVIKFILIVLAAALIGAFSGYLGAAHSDGAKRMLLGNIMPGIIAFTKEYGAIVYCSLVLLTLLIGFIRSGRVGKTVDTLLATDEDDPTYDELYETADKLISNSILWNEVILFVLQFLFMFTSYHLLTNSDFIVWKLISVLVGIVVVLWGYTGMFQKMIKEYQRIRPEITVNPMDMKINEKLIHEMDEREQELTYKATYHAFLWMKKFSVFMLAITFVLSLMLELGTLPIFISTLYALVQQFVYVTYANQETKSV